MEESKDYDYAVEYAKSNRASCRDCKSLIAKDSLRLAYMVQSRLFDGKQANWYHYTCFFRKYRPSSSEDIKNFNNLRFPDQEKICVQIEAVSKGLKPKKGGPKVISTTLKDFVVQYASSNRSKCRGCEEKIEKDEIRFSHKEKHPDKPQLGLVDRWHHVGCFMKQKNEMGWEDHFTADMVTGFQGLDSDDKTQIRKLLAPRGKAKKKVAQTTSSQSQVEQEDLKKKIKAQSTLMWKNIDKMKSLDLRKNVLIDILDENNQRIPTGVDALFLAIGDGMTFGALPPCDMCKSPELTVSSDGYKCKGQISEWTRCTFTTRDVQRTPWVFPKDVKEADPFFAKYKYKKRERIFPAKAPFLPLKGKKVIVVGKVALSKSDVKEAVEKLGGAITTSVSPAYFCISSKEAVEKLGRKIADAQVQDVFVVSENILQDLQELVSPQPLLALLKKHSICDWGSEQSGRGSGKRVLEEQKNNNESTKKMKLVVKGGVAVDQESGLEHKAHVLVKGKLKYTATLSMVDMNHGYNSYYKLQLLEADAKKKYYVFRSWGRVGTSIGGDKIEDFYSVESAIENFNEVYQEKTGNTFGTRNFQKMPRKFYPLDIDYGDQDEKLKSLQSAGSNSTLHKNVQNIIKMIFDIESMKKALVEFELDLKKMPLGKLSKKQLQKAYTVLTEVTEVYAAVCQTIKVAVLIESGNLTKPKALDCSNRFYTLIPHDFGMKQPPLLDNVDLIKSKAEMIDNLLDIEVAYNLLQGDEQEDIKEESDPIDVQYQKLQCKIEPMDHASDMYEVISKMAKNTHAETHSSYVLEVEDIFELDRKGEKSRFRPFKKLHNRQLLWHGSRVTNYAGILSQGLRIAPPEAPVTGYMFGKGIYFADMVSKSANYCHPSHSNTCGLLLLAEVALGNMYELKDAKNVVKLPKGKHSVKGVGSTCPDESNAYVTEDGTVAHVGCGKKADIDRTSLLYNEYIVYDAAQVNLKYLVKTKFNMHSMW